MIKFHGEKNSVFLKRSVTESVNNGKLVTPSQIAPVPLFSHFDMEL